MTRILIIDRELGFMLALAQQLEACGLATIPSSSVTEAKRVLAATRAQLSLIIINCRCEGVCLFAEQLRKKHRRLQVIGIVSRGYRCRACSRTFVATLHDPEDRRPERVAHCAEVVRILAERTSLE
jgi:DNA-binding NtrC family response regulator